MVPSNEETVSHDSHMIRTMRGGRRVGGYYTSKERLSCTLS